MQMIISGLTRCILAKNFAGCTIEDNPLQVTVVLMSQRVQGMPLLLKWPMVILTNIFDWCGLVRGRRRFQLQSLPNQIQQLSSWANSPVSFCREFVHFYEKMIVFIYLSQNSSFPAQSGYLKPSHEH